MDSRKIAMGTLLVGASAIGFAPILVRWSEVGPVATAFYRLLIALPVLWLGSRRVDETRTVQPPRGQIRRTILIAGICFAGDLAFWHWSIRLTSVANSTLLTNFAPLFVAMGARLFLGERISIQLVLGMALAFTGGAMLVSRSLGLSSTQVWGDVLALITAVFYAGYLVAMKWLRRYLPTASVMLSSGIISAVVLYACAALGGEDLWPETWRGWAVLGALAIVSHILGQGLIAFSLAHLNASYSAVSLLFQPVVAAILAWALLGESLTLVQIAGGVVVLLGIGCAARSSAA